MGVSNLLPGKGLYVLSWASPMNLLICDTKVFCRLMAPLSSWAYVGILMLRNWFLSPYFCRKTGETSVHIEDSITAKTTLSFWKEGGLLTCCFNTIPNPDLGSEGGGFYDRCLMVFTGRMFLNGKRGRRSLQPEPDLNGSCSEIATFEREPQLFRNGEHEPFGSATERASLHLNSMEPIGTHL